MGIIDSAMQPQPAQAPPQPPPQQPPQPPQQAQAAPQPGGKVDAVVLARVDRAAAKMLYLPETVKHLLALIKKAPSPEAGLAQATLLILTELVKKSHDSIPQNIRTPAGKKILMRIAEIAHSAGLIEDVAAATQQAGQMIAQAILQAAKISPDKLRKPAAQQQPVVQQPPAVQQPAMQG